MSDRKLLERENSWKVSRIMRNVVPLLIFLTLLELGSGYVLEGLKETFVNNPALLVLVPPIKDLAGNFGSVIASRVSTRLHLGIISDEDSMLGKKTLSDCIGIILLAFILSFFLALFTYFFVVITGGTLNFIIILKISMFTSLMLALFVIILGVSVVLISFKRRIEPDDVAIPIVTNFADIFGIIIFAVVVFIVV